MYSATRHRSTVRLGVESLESRLTPAGNLSAYVTNGILHVEADRSSHTFSVYVRDDRIILTTHDTTTINGVAGPNGSFASLTFLGGENAISAVEIDGNRGNDVVGIVDQLTASRQLDVTARTGGSGDSISLFDSDGLGGMIVGTVNFDTGDGNDRVTVNGSWAGVSLGANLGSGDDSLKITGTVGNVSALNGGPGNRDAIEIPANLYALYSASIAGFENILLR